MPAASAAAMASQDAGALDARDLEPELRAVREGRLAVLAGDPGPSNASPTHLIRPHLFFILAERSVVFSYGEKYFLHPNYRVPLTGSRAPGLLIWSRVPVVVAG